MVKRIIRHRRVASISGKHDIQKNTMILLAVTVLLLAVTAWSYWRIVASLFREWNINDDYSAGQLVPLVALFFVWRERKNLRRCRLKPCWLWGIALLILAQTTRFFGLIFMFQSIDNYSLVLTIAGLVLIVAGWQVFRHVFWIILFMFLMLPLPGRVHNLISGPLQRLATAGSVFILEAFFPVSHQGNVMMLNENTPLGVEEACSGLRMLTAFIVVAYFIAYMVNRSRLQKAVLLISSIPVALICNIIRIVATAVLMLLVNAEVAHKFFHDFAGLVMMPAAVLLMFGELWLMNKVVEPQPEPQQIHARTRPKTSKPPAKRMAKIEQSL